MVDKLLHATVAGELKQAIVTMMLKKDDIEEHNK